MIPVARFDRVSLDLGRRRVLDDVTLELPARGCTAMVGPNGCGKSTLARMLAGFLYPTIGTIEVLGGRLGEVNVHELRRRVKLVQPSMPHEPDAALSVRDVVLTGTFGTVNLYDDAAAGDRGRAESLVARFGLAAVVDHPFRHCSSGERMRTQLARSLMSRPRLLILDEPTGGLDLPARERLLATIDATLAAADAPSILIVTHHVEELPAATSQVVLMRAGRILHAGPPADVLTSANLTATFAFPIDVARVGDCYAATVAADARRGFE